MTLREQINTSDFGTSLSEWLVAFIEKREEAERRRVKKLIKTLVSGPLDVALERLLYPPKKEKLPPGYYWMMKNGNVRMYQADEEFTPMEGVEYREANHPFGN